MGGRSYNSIAESVAKSIEANQMIGIWLAESMEPQSNLHIFLDWIRLISIALSHSIDSINSINSITLIDIYYKGFF